MDIRYLKGVGEKRALLFKKLGVDSVDALLSFYPRVYEDWTKIVSIADAPLGEVCCIKAIVGHDPIENKIRKGLSIYKTVVTDGESLMNITIFNSKYTADKLKEGEEYLFFGRADIGYSGREMNSPLIEKAGSGEKIRPIYPLTHGLTSKVVESAVKSALAVVGDKIKETLPDEIEEEYGLISKKAAVYNIHFPKSQYYLEEARRRLIFEELLVLQLGLMLLKNRNRRLTAIKAENDYTQDFYKYLKFTPTNAQKRAIKEAVADMKSDVPMTRLLQGDVGSGKTVVAAALMYNMCRNSFQSAMMAPTEILAQQHYMTLVEMLKDTDIKIALLTGSTTAAQKRKIKKALEDGEIDIAVGTHALIQNDVIFKNLGLVITDEQHRFGVKQRSALSEKGKNVHTFVMSATPIPRTLALIIYGDLDISVLDELPKGRQVTETYAVTTELRKRAYNYVKKHLDEGRQGFVICPLIEENESSTASAIEYAEKLAKEDFRNYKVALLHGKMKAAEKKAVMDSFAAGETDLLVSTTVIEVGVDVPNAAIMIIENAELFGLSQLHQLRGRIGRGKHKSTCILISDAKTEETKQRLNTMCKTTDGFKIADEDLKLRGPGDFFGARQHGLPEMKIANILDDMEMLRATQHTAKQILTSEEGIRAEKYSALRELVRKLFENVGENSMN